MKFIPAGEVIGDAHQVRSVRIAQSPQLPDGEYSFIDMYCIDASCDCRKTMIHVTHGERTVATINFGWESDTYYKKWMGIEEDEDLFLPMSGANVDLSSPNLVDSKGVLTLFNSLLNDIWIARFKRHYQLVKAAVSKSPLERKAMSTHIREAPKVGRNDLCSCNSGKKFKKCCGSNK